MGLMESGWISSSDNEDTKGIFSHNKKRLNIRSARSDRRGQWRWYKKRIVYLGSINALTCCWTRISRLRINMRATELQGDYWKGYWRTNGGYIFNRYDIVDKKIIVFTINAKFDSRKSFKSVPISRRKTWRKLSKEVDLYTFEESYCYLIYLMKPTPQHP